MALLSSDLPQSTPPVTTTTQAAVENSQRSNPITQIPGPTLPSLSQNNIEILHMSSPLGPEQQIPNPITTTIPTVHENQNLPQARNLNTTQILLNHKSLPPPNANSVEVVDGTTTTTISENENPIPEQYP